MKPQKKKTQLKANHLHDLLFSTNLTKFSAEKNLSVFVFGAFHATLFVQTVKATCEEDTTDSQGNASVLSEEIFQAVVDVESFFMSPLKGDMGPNKYPRVISCIWGWLLRIPSQGYHIFPVK